jgi:hypothetical protein
MSEAPVTITWRKPDELLHIRVHCASCGAEYSFEAGNEGPFRAAFAAPKLLAALEEALEGKTVWRLHAREAIKEAKGT